MLVDAQVRHRYWGPPQQPGPPPRERLMRDRPGHPACRAASADVIPRRDPGRSLLPQQPRQAAPRRTCGTHSVNVFRTTRLIPLPAALNPHARPGSPARRTSRGKHSAHSHVVIGSVGLAGVTGRMPVPGVARACRA